MRLGDARMWSVAAGSVALLFAASSCATAALYELRGGTPVTLPVGLASTDHQVLGIAVPTLDLDGFVGGSLVTLVPDLILSFTYLSSESKDRNILLASSLS